MSNTTITSLPTASGVDGAADWLAIDRTSLGATQKINRQTFLGVTGQPMDISSSQNVTNKTLDNTNTITLKDTLFTLQDDGDTTKQARFQLSGITTATTRTYTLPNASSTIADISSSQTFTNKTLTAPVINNGSITGTTITTDAIVGQSVSTNGTVYGLSISSSKISGTSITNASITTIQIASNTVAASNINFGGAGSGIWWQEIARTTLAVAGDTITVNSITAKKYLQIRIAVMGTGGTIDVAIRLNNDTGANYSVRSSTNGAADSTSTSQTSIVLTGAATYPVLSFNGDVVNVATVEKNIIGFRAGNFSGTGAGTAPDKAELVGKWANTANQISRVDILNLAGTGDFAIGSEVIILGHD